MNNKELDQLDELVGSLSKYGIKICLNLDGRLVKDVPRIWVGVQDDHVLVEYQTVKGFETSFMPTHSSNGVNAEFLGDDKVIVKKEGYGLELRLSECESNPITDNEYIFDRLESTYFRADTSERIVPPRNMLGISKK